MHDTTPMQDTAVPVTRAPRVVRNARRLRVPAVTAAVAAVAVAAAPVAASAPASGSSAGPPTDRDGECRQGQFCVWSGEDYGGERISFSLRNTNPESCAALPDAAEGIAFANRIDRHVTVYQDRHCATEGDFSTYPGPGTFVPRSPYVVRAVKIWD
ncbi:peptidase inhibitor family I36 protein [Saccharomonospora iraqiensis]|uniref:peptidase inhibitor family I36 protein n=1 Tax=Saccharomonospora iraqiensis TaxID=52698 RepID=UPI00022DF4ED|nr:peptidase inhibitor family I36 protein [Saccharomonospora iraqiensis]